MDLQGRWCAETAKPVDRSANFLLPLLPLLLNFVFIRLPLLAMLLPPSQVKVFPLYQSNNLRLWLTYVFSRKKRLAMLLTKGNNRLVKGVFPDLLQKKRYNFFLLPMWMFLTMQKRKSTEFIIWHWKRLPFRRFDLFLGGLENFFFCTPHNFAKVE